MPERFASRTALVAEVRSRGGLAAALDAGMEADQMPDEELREQWRRLGQARDAYADAVCSLEASIAGLDDRPARPSEPVNPSHLVVGYTVFRYTEPARGLLESWIPCCGRPVRMAPDSGPLWAVCCSCHLAYGLTLEDDADGGAYAVFTVAVRRVVVAKHRAPPTAALSPPPRRPDTTRRR